MSTLSDDTLDDVTKEEHDAILESMGDSTVEKFFSIINRKEDKEE